MESVTYPGIRFVVENTKSNAALSVFETSSGTHPIPIMIRKAFTTIGVPTKYVADTNFLHQAEWRILVAPKLY